MTSFPSCAMRYAWWSRRFHSLVISHQNPNLSSGLGSVEVVSSSAAVPERSTPQPISLPRSRAPTAVSNLILI